MSIEDNIDLKRARLVHMKIIRFCSDVSKI